MKNGAIAALVFGYLFIAECAAGWDTFFDLKHVDPSSQHSLSFDANDAQYRRISAMRNHQKEGWVEFGIWQAQTDTGKDEVMIYLASLFGEYSFQKKHVQEMQELVGLFTSESDVNFGKQGQAKSDSGPIDYLFYKWEARPCVFIRKYWSDPRSSSDISRAVGLQWAAGENFIYAYYCKASGDPLQMQDMNLLFAGVRSKDVYWPGNMFTVVDEPDITPAVSTETPPGDFDLTGIYTSKVTRNNGYFCFNQKKKFDINLIQTGSKVNGTFMSGITGEISGEISGNKVKFTWYTVRCNSGHEGEWTVDPDGLSMKGYGWSELAWEAQKK